jgi:hypothetical protein
MRLPLPLSCLLLALAGCDQPGAVVLNEFLASNITGLTDAAGATPDWIELYNASAEDVPLDGWFLSDDAGNPRRHPLDGLVVPGDGFLLLFASGQTAQGPEHLPFRLSAAGEQLVLTEEDVVVDSVDFGAQVADVSMARIPDGSGDFVAGTPTPGAPNEAEAR